LIQERDNRWKKVVHGDWEGEKKGARPGGEEPVRTRSGPHAPKKFFFAGGEKEHRERS